MKKHFLFNRRDRLDRRGRTERRENPRLDLSYRRRRSLDERRYARGLVTDFHASKPRFSESDKPTDTKH